MRLALVYLPDAEFDLGAIYDVIAADSPSAAIRFVEDLKRRCEAFADFPGMGRPMIDNLFEFTFDRRVRVIYAVTDSELQVSQFRYLGQQ
ncbi:type II toxin-antitoxin system RelE/ParE family toxin [Brevundimonas sp.]|uniref:type II toxin-antitoxin system RelE/ParE family toxin n=1 Tax=Brevundimonas sp. TaxID=1871086 RepID=UPI002D29E19D|nr:type II toxin-antitoxin system RelE/ParE family toxin [Brevundimonas sp.]HYC68312.1 type II toxin-antitoxin system RelE/ParE family toxin [Brevundimonas sp.]